METKQEIRKKVLLERDSLSKLERDKGNLLVTEKILGHQWYYKASHILMFLSYSSEIDTKMILKDALEKKKKVYAPRVEGENINFYQVEAKDQLEEGFKGILEPSKTKSLFTYTKDMAEHTLMIMPGVAFDKFRNRLGYGKGFYDRFLQDKETLHTIAIGYKCQLVEAVPSVETDKRPDQIICF